MEIISICQSDKQHTDFSEYYLNYWKIFFMRQGTGTITIEDCRYFVKSGDTIVISPGLMYSKSPSEDILDICMYVKDFRPVGSTPYRILHDDAQGSVARLMNMAIDFSNPENYYERAILNAIADLLYQVLVYIYVDDQDKDIRLERIMEEMQENIGNSDYDLSAAIEKSGYSKGHFRKIFKALTGQAPVNYMQTLRINHAKSLLHQFGKSRNIKDIAHSSGFKDPLYFTRVFKKLEGMSPKAYLKQHSMMP